MSFLSRVGASANLIFWCVVSIVASALYILGVCVMGLIEEWKE